MLHKYYFSMLVTVNVMRFSKSTFLQLYVDDVPVCLIPINPLDVCELFLYILILYI